MVLCRECHEAVHMAEWRLSVDGDIARGYMPNSDIVCFERGLVVRDEDEPDARFWSDTKLATAWVKGEEASQMALQIQAASAHSFWLRYKNNEHWYERAAEIIKQETGHYVHWRRIYEYVDLYLEWHEDWARAFLLGKTLALAVATADDKKAARTIAEAARDNGRTAASAIREIRGQPEPQPKKCPNCGWGL